MYYLGVDGGGTKTTALLFNSKNKSIHTLKKGAGNIAVRGRQAISSLISEIVSGLLKEIEIEKVKGATFAFAGAGRQEEKKALREIISDLGITNFSLMTDAEILHYAIHGDDQGILIASGTGSVCIINNREKQYEQIGGWGYLLGDEGSGYDIGRRAIRNALKEKDLAEPPSPLTRKLLAHYGVEDLQALISLIYSSDNPQNFVASAAKIVCDLALNKEPDATRIVDSAAEALLELALLGVDRLHVQPPYKIALAGGILNEPAIVTSRFKEKAEQRNLAFQYQSQKMTPAAAAVLHALKSAGAPVSDSITEKLQKVTF